MKENTFSAYALAALASIVLIQGSLKAAETAPASTQKNETATVSDNTAVTEAAFPDTADTAEEKEAMEIGGLVTVDATFDPKNKGADRGKIGEVDLSANVNVAEGVTASITVLAEENMAALSIDQALVQAAPKGSPFTFLFGQQTFNFGLLSTRLISDPAITDDVETRGPGVVVSYSNGAFTPALAGSFVHTDAVTERVYRLNLSDTTVAAIDSAVSEESNSFEGILNLDFKLGGESTGRLAARYYGDILDISLGSGLVVGPALLDVELYGEIAGDDQSKKGGYYAGLAYDISDKLQAAVRYDGISTSSFKEITHRIAIGSTMRFSHGIFCALEYSVDDIGSSAKKHELSLQAGLESTIKLPGFQRKTLTRNQ
jgi:hypothetical protein